MNRSTLVWTVVLMLGAGFIGLRAATSGMGLEYVRAVEVKPTGGAAGWTNHVSADPIEKGDPLVSLSLPRTLGLWIAAFFTLCIFSFLYGDNVFYKLAESVMIGVTAAYAVVVGFWTMIVDNLLANLVPDLMRSTILPALPKDKVFDWIYLIPLALSIMMLMRLSPRGGWISRWPVAFFIGATAGFKLVGYFHSDFVEQIQSTILPLVVVVDKSVDIGQSIKNVLIFVGVLSCLVYFFFSFEHKGAVGRVARLGIWFLMITFGASFGYTVMGRIALLAKRLEFLFDDWMWIIDPAARRLGL
ncbi:MAG: hypothetical protein AB7O26_06035 [Planctomycetaceae bacterium]